MKMKIPIDINIKSERLFSDLTKQESEPETDIYKVSGFMKKMKNGLKLEFSEGKKDENVTTTICAYNDKTVSLSRVGNQNSQMVFADGKALNCICDTGYFPLQMRIVTKKLENSLSVDGGKLDIDYTVEIVGNLAEQNRLTFSVSPDKSIIKS